MLNTLKHKIINERYLSKKEFYKYYFWFEADFEYLNRNNTNSDNNSSNINNSPLRFKRSTISKKTNLKRSERRNTRQILASSLPLEKISKKLDENKSSVSIKDLLFNIWKDDKGNFNFRDFINLLKYNKYKSNIDENNEERYFDIIFNE